MSFLRWRRLTNDLGGTLTARTIENIPVNWRELYQTDFSDPGVAGSPDQITDSPGSFGIFSMNGARGLRITFCWMARI